MHVRAEATFPAAPEVVAAMMADEDYVRTKAAATGSQSHQARVEADGSGGFTVTTYRQMPTDQIPAQFRSLVGDTVEVRQVETWQAAGPHGRDGTVLVEVQGAPVRMTGTSTLRAGGEGTQVVVEGELVARVPLFGGMVERAVAGAVTDAARAEEQAGRAWLATQGT